MVFKIHNQKSLKLLAISKKVFKIKTYGYAEKLPLTLKTNCSFYAIFDPYMQITRIVLTLIYTEC